MELNAFTTACHEEFDGAFPAIASMDVDGAIHPFGHRKYVVKPLFGIRLPRFIFDTPSIDANLSKSYPILVGIRVELIDVFVAK